MMKACFILILLIIESNCLLPPEKREELINKYTTEITPDIFTNFDEDFGEYKFMDDDPLKDGLKYDVDIIYQILENYSFPENFDFLEEHDITPNVKNQKKCGCCWSHAATTALAYRYYLLGYDISLSPQDALSCYIKDCELGNFGIDAQMNLVKNGTVTEECLPFSSDNGTITDECPTETCKDGVTKPKKYYSQKAYSTRYNLNQENYYDIVTLMIDQLIFKGPIVADIYVYDDFMNIHRNQSLCTNTTVYTYDGKSSFTGGHAIVIVGYGFLDGKFYWKIQNSWGTDVCDNGFVKIEFGQVYIENVAFSEPYVEPEEITPYEIKVKYSGIDELCKIKIELENESDINNWNNTLEFHFQSENGRDNLYIQCAIISTDKAEKKLDCFAEVNKYYIPKNNFKFKEYKSLGKENTFNLGDLYIEDFYYYGQDYIGAGLSGEQYIFISDEKSKIVLYFNEIDLVKDYLPNIYANKNSLTPLSGCKRNILYNEEDGFGNQYIIICDLKKEEIDYFDDYSKENQNDMVYDHLCGGKDVTYVYVYKIDKEKYPVFKVKNAYLQDDQIQHGSIVLLEVVNQGTIPEDFSPQDFVGYTYLEYDNKNITYLILCNTGEQSQSRLETNITCNILTNSETLKNYNNLYILPFSLPFESNYPLEVSIENVIKVENPGKEPEPTDSDIPIGTDSDIPIETDSDAPKPTDSDTPIESDTDMHTDTSSPIVPTVSNYLKLSFLGIFLFAFLF